MATARDLATAIDAFVGAPKRIIGADQPYLWKDGRSYVERVASFPIEINGEAPQAARFEVIGFPQATQLKFRLILCYMWTASWQVLF